MKYVLDVSKWICGGGVSHPESREGCSIGTGFSQMLNSEGFMCCLGQFAKQKGVKDSLLLNRTSPTRVEQFSNVGQYDPTFLDEECCHTQLSMDLMRINDDRSTKIEDKIESIRSLLAAEGHELEVINA